MAFLLSLALVELTCLISLAASRAWGALFEALLLVAAQLVYLAWRWEVHRRECWRASLSTGMQRGLTYPAAAMFATFAYPDLRIRTRLLRDGVMAFFEQEA